MGFNDNNWRTKDQGPLKELPAAQLNSIDQPFQPKSNLRGAQTINPGAGYRAKRQVDKGPPRVTYKLPQQHHERAPGESHGTNYEVTQGLMVPNGKSRISNFGTNPAVTHQDDRPEMLLKHEFREGMIINAPYFEEDRNQGESHNPTNYRSKTTLGFVHHKNRYMIIVKLYQAHYVAVPLYTNDKKGLEGKQHYAKEFVSVRDGRVREKDFRNLSRVYDGLVTDGKGAKIHPLTVGWLTRTVSRDYGLGVSRCGDLTEESLGRLKAYMKEF